ncbi:MAG: DUF2813 domain-containing protein [Brevundimonas sp.]|nr:MAG: DUF2813 domain-containing protein [Brevundimonas sp.]
MLRLKSIEIRNFRAIEHAIVPLDRNLTVLVGENAVGKTAILDAIAMALSPLIDQPGPRQSRQPALSDYRVTGLADPTGEVKRADFISLEVEEDAHGGWHCRYDLSPNERPIRRAEVRGIGPYRFRERLDDDGATVPVIASYGADRALSTERSRATNARRFSSLPGRLGGYLGSLESRAVYNDAAEWFEAIENLELRNNRESPRSYSDPRLDAVRKAITQLVPELENPRMVGLPARMMVDARMRNRPPESLAVEQLSGGYRTMLALIIDLARRMAELNPHLSDPLSVDGVVLIDEIDLHLHPRWQQLVIDGLRRMFPNVQFVLTTHSPQVLSTLEAHNVRNLTWSSGSLVEGSVTSTSGAESGRLLSEVMGVEERPPARVSAFVSLLESYRSLVADGGWETPEALQLLDRLRRESPDDPVIGALDLERRRLTAQRRLASREA